MRNEEQLLETVPSNINPDFWADRNLFITGDQNANNILRRVAFAAVAFLFWFFSVMLIVFVPAIFIIPYFISQNVPLTDTVLLTEFAKSDSTAIVIQIAAIIPAHLLTILLGWLIVTRGKQFSFLETLGWRSGGFAWWQYIAVLVGFGLIAVAVGNLMPEQENDLIRILKSSRTAVYFVATVAILTAPFVEELVYRGVLYSAFQRAMGVPAAFVLVTFLFALVHVPQYWPSFSTIILLTLLSVILTAIRVKTGNLLPCVIFHTIFNAIQSIILIIEPHITSPELHQQTATIFIK